VQIFDTANHDKADMTFFMQSQQSGTAHTEGVVCISFPCSGGK